MSAAAWQAGCGRVKHERSCVTGDTAVTVASLTAQAVDRCRNVRHETNPLGYLRWSGLLWSLRQRRLHELRMSYGHLEGLPLTMPGLPTIPRIEDILCMMR